MSMEKTQFQIAKTVEDQRLVFGFANISVDPDGETVTDKHGDQIPPSVLEKAAYRFVVQRGEGGLEHQYMGVATLVESFFLTAEKVEAMGLSDPSFRGAAWWIGFRVDDSDVWAAVKSGELAAFSIAGRAEIEEVDE